MRACCGVGSHTALVAIRPVKRLIQSKRELSIQWGGGVHLAPRPSEFEIHRRFDPFLLIDDFPLDVPERLTCGLSLAPHAAILLWFFFFFFPGGNITYVLAGREVGALATAMEE